MPIDTPPSAPRFAPQESPHRRIIIAAVALILALLALAVPVLWLGSQTGRAMSAETRPVAEPTPVQSARPSTSFSRGYTKFFGFLEFDWDPDAPGGVPGFDPWPSDAGRR